MLEVKSIFTWNLNALLSGQWILEMKFIWSHLLKYALFFTALNSQWKAQVSERAWLLATAKPKAATLLIAAVWLVPELRPPQLLQ
jgi:hypothetical protein